MFLIQGLYIICSVICMQTPTPVENQTETVSLFSQFQLTSRKMTAAENAVVTSESSASAAAAG